jgi:hypothetical protein
VTIAHLALCALTATLPTAPTPDLPADPAQRAATKALRGDFGTLKPWQEKGYILLLASGARADRTFVLTQYNGDEPDGIWDRHDGRCTLRTAASNKVPQYAYIWTEPSNLRQVLDTGSTRNDAKARRKAGQGAIWVDVWYRHASHAKAAGIDGWVPVRGAVVSK